MNGQKTLSDKVIEAFADNGIETDGKIEEVTNKELKEKRIDLGFEVMLEIDGIKHRVFLAVNNLEDLKELMLGETKIEERDLAKEYSEQIKNIVAGKNENKSDCLTLPLPTIDMFLDKKRNRMKISTNGTKEFITCIIKDSEKGEKEKAMGVLEEYFRLDIEEANGDINIEDEALVYFVGIQHASASGEESLVKNLNKADHKEAANNALDKWIAEHLEGKEG